MDMAVANLFKHKALFRRVCNRWRDDNHPDYRRFYREYRSKPIENLRSVGVTDINELCLKCLEPFMVHIISQLVVEETEHIDYIDVYAGMFETDPFHEDGHDMVSISLDNPKLCLHVLSSNSETTIYPFEKRLLDGSFILVVYAYFGFLTPIGRESAILEGAQYIVSREEIEEEEEEYTPPIETYRQDRCVVCLESKPNILYLECMHIAICDSCDRLKKTKRKKCDVCRTKISKRIKI